MDAASAAVAETHVSWVFFAGDRAYKLKKPVRMPFLDYSTRERREAICHREVELNRRLAPDVYLGVADVVGPDGEVCDHLVVMRRMPESARLSSLVSSGAAVGDCVREIAREVAAFHASAARGAAIDEVATRDALRARWRADVAETSGLEALDPDEVQAVGALAERYLDGRAQLFDRRIADGRIVDGHGDLLAGDIFCLPDGPRILDCIEFDDRLRYGDVLADTAFLAMDLERLGATGLAGRFLGWYREFGDETSPDSLVHHYVAFRAHIRAKVAAIRHAQGDGQSRAEAARLLRIAHDHLETARVRLVLVGGPPGTGKSTVAVGLSDMLRYALVRSDEVRKDLAGVGHFERMPAGYRAGAYSAEHTEATYGELLRRARTALEYGESVVLDASWAQARHRDLAAALARDTAADVVALRCDAPAEVARSRLRARDSDASDATPEVADVMRRDAEPWPDARLIDTSGRARDAVAAAAGAVVVAWPGVRGTIGTPAGPSHGASSAAHV